MMKELTLNGNFSALRQSMICGQAFRWNLHYTQNKAYGVVDRMSFLEWDNNNCHILNDDSTIDWIDYLGNPNDWETLYSMAQNTQFYGRDYCLKALENAPYLTIFKQDPWEMIISYILSQNTHFDLICRNVHNLSKKYGMETSLEIPLKLKSYTFPTLVSLKTATSEDLWNLHLGYKANYVYNIVQLVKDQQQFIETLTEMPTTKLIQTLQSYYGIGIKVASCIALYGFNRTEIFPIDTWIKKIIALKFNDYFDSTVFGKYAGLLQQCLYLYGRNNL